jgi:hypothetical protein
LFVTNGESAGSTLRTIAADAVVLSWDDILHVGPLAFDPDECRRLRAAFLAEHGWGRQEAILIELERRDELLERAADGGRRVVLWFERDLVDQLQLLQILARLSPTHHLELVQTEEYLGSLDAAALELAGRTRRRVEAGTIALARDAWQAVCDDELEPLLRRDLRALPHLEPALRRFIEERAPLPRTKRQLLEALLDGPKTPLGLFLANAKREEAVFLGDTWCFLFLYELAEAALVTPLPLPPPRGDHDAFTATTVALTAEGRALVSAG